MMNENAAASGPFIVEAATTDVPRGERRAYWASVFGRIWGEVDLFSTGTEEAFFGTARTMTVGGLSLNRLTFQGMGFHRTRQQVRRMDSPFYSLAFPVRGRSIATISADPVALQPGSVFLLDNSRPSTLMAPGVYKTLNIQIPIGLLRDRLGLKITARPLAVASPAAELLRHYVRSLADASLLTDCDSAAFVQRQICDLVGFCFQSAAAVRSEEGILLSAHRRGVEEQIRRLYPDEDLCPDKIAAACGISVSYLHKIYRGSGVSVMRQVQDTRLAAADRLLTAPGAATISEIAYATGFKSLSDFSRVYKRRFGTSPRQARGERAGQ